MNDTHDESGYRRVAFRVHPNSYAVLDDYAARLTGGSKSELIRRAVSVFKLIEDAKAKDPATEVLLRRGDKISELVAPFW